jgi:reactive intermediate/imine deaminase
MRTAAEGTNNPPPAGPYSHAVMVDRLIATAGQVGVDPLTGEPAGPDVRSQTRQAIANLQAVLEESGAGLESIFKVGVYLTRYEDFAAMNEVYRELMPAPFPARSTVYVGLNPGLLVEIDALAYVDQPGQVS